MGGGHMGWDGTRIKALAKEKGIKLVSLAENLNITRQTINDWINGQVPKGTHLVALSKIFNVPPGHFFPDEAMETISLPLHRTRGVARLTGAMEEDAKELASDYEGLFRFAPSPGLVQVLRGGRDSDTARNLAQNLRSMVQMDTDKPMDYEHTFKLLAKLNIVCIFKEFPSNIKSYAFYCRIHNHRVVFVNTKTNVLDLIFPLLHETMHAVRDGEGAVLYDEEEEGFCDMAAGHTQFPDTYIDMVYDSIKGRPEAQQVTLLKKFSGTHSHSVFGICTQIESRHGKINLNIGGAHTNLKKDFLSIGEILFKSKEPQDYLLHLRSLSPLFFDIVSRQIDNASIRKFGEWLGLDNTSDAENARNEWRKILE